MNHLLKLNDRHSTIDCVGPGVNSSAVCSWALDDARKIADITFGRPLLHIFCVRQCMQTTIPLCGNRGKWYRITAIQLRPHGGVDRTSWN